MKHVPARRRHPLAVGAGARLEADAAVVVLDHDHLGDDGRRRTACVLDDRVGRRPEQPHRRVQLLGDHARRFPQLEGAEGEEGVQEHAEDAEIEDEQGALEAGHVAEEDDGPPVALVEPCGLGGRGVGTVARKQNQRHEQKEQRRRAAHEEHEEVVVGVAAQRLRLDGDAACDEGDVAWLGGHLGLTGGGGGKPKTQVSRLFA